MSRCICYWVELYILMTSLGSNHILTYCIGEYPLFYATNHPNSARYMVRYHLNVLNIDIRHPWANDILRAGGYSVRRTSKTFSRSTVDPTLKQMVNADAALRMTRVKSFTRNRNARIYKMDDYSQWGAQSLASSLTWLEWNWLLTVFDQSPNYKR